MQDKRRIHTTILTDRGKELLAKGELNFSFFSLSDEETDYSYLSQSFSNDSTNIEAYVPKEMRLEPFELSLSASTYPTQDVPTIFDKETLDNNRIPFMSSSVTNSGKSMYIYYNEYLNNIIQTAEDANTIDNLINQIDNGGITQDDLYKYDELMIDFHITDGINQFVNEYGCLMEMYDSNGDKMHIIKKDPDNPFTFSIGRIIGDTFDEQFVVMLPEEIDVEYIHDALSAGLNAASSTLGYKDIDAVRKYLKVKKGEIEANAKNTGMGSVLIPKLPKSEEKKKDLSKGAEKVGKK